MSVRKEAESGPDLEGAADGASSSPGVDSEGRGSARPSEDILRVSPEIVRRFIRQRASKFSPTLSGRADVRLASAWLDRCRRLADYLATRAKTPCRSCTSLDPCHVAKSIVMNIHFSGRLLGLPQQ
jgi:hypothetical protein